MSYIDCECFIQGAEEIDRKRRVITRIIKTVESLLNHMPYERRNAGRIIGTDIKVSLGKLTFALTYHKGEINGRLLDQDGKNNIWWEGNYAEAISASIVPIVYTHLSQIVEQADKIFPEAGIRAHFEFFSKQAD